MRTFGFYSGSHGRALSGRGELTASLCPSGCGGEIWAGQGVRNFSDGPGKEMITAGTRAVAGEGVGSDGIPGSVLDVEQTGFVDVHVDKRGCGAEAPRLCAEPLESGGSRLLRRRSPGGREEVRKRRSRFCLGLPEWKVPIRHPSGDPKWVLGDLPADFDEGLGY